LATFRELITKWTFQADHAKLDAVENQLEGIKHRLDFLAAAEITRAIFEVAEKFAELAEDIHLSSQAAGIGVEAFQKLAASEKESGVGQDEMSMAMTRLNRKLYDARQGGEEAQKAFAQLGLTPDQVKGFRNSEDALLAISGRMQNLTDVQQKTALTMEIFGRGGARMNNWLSQGPAKIKAVGNEFGELGAIMGEEQIHALVELEHAFQKIWGVIRGIAGVIASVFAPEIKYLIDTIIGWVKANKQLIQGDLQRWIRDFLYGIGFIWGAIEGLIRIILKWSESHKTLSRLIITALAIAAAVVAVGVAVLALSPIFSAVGGAIALIFSPLTLVVLAVGLLIVAVHDLWAAAHGKPTWISQFLEWLGVADQVNDAFQWIFQTISDLLNLRLGDFFMDAVKPVMALFDAWKGIVGFVTSAGSGVGQGLVDGFKSFWNIGGGQDAAANVQNLPNVAGTPNFAAPGGSASNSYSLNAPININVPPGTDAKDIGKHVQTGVKEHLDRVYRETQRSLQPAQAY
jgi:hypothetical protein